MTAVSSIFEGAEHVEIDGKSSRRELVAILVNRSENKREALEAERRRPISVHSTLDETDGKLVLISSFFLKP